MNITLTQATFDRIMRAVAKVEGVKVTGAARVINGTNTLAIHIPAPEPARAPQRRGTEMVVVRLTGFSGLGIGKYYGRIRIRPADETNLQNSSNLSGLPGTEPAADNALCLHLKEMGGATRILAVGNYCVGIVWGRDDSGKTLVVLSDVPVQICS